MMEPETLLYVSSLNDLCKVKSSKDIKLLNQKLDIKELTLETLNLKSSNPKLSTISLSNQDNGTLTIKGIDDINLNSEIPLEINFKITSQNAMPVYTPSGIQLSDKIILNSKYITLLETRISTLEKRLTNLISQHDFHIKANRKI